MILTCYACGASTDLAGPVGRRDVCPHCGADLRCCLQCTLYAPDTPSTCREPQADPPRDKDRGNFCEFFIPGPGAAKQASDAEKAKAAFDALFTKK